MFHDINGTPELEQDKEKKYKENRDRELLGIYMQKFLKSLKDICIQQHQEEQNTQEQILQKKCKTITLKATRCC